MDLDITIEENRFITKIYHKVDDFDFEVVSFPFPTSNMSDHITYNSFYSQLVRFSFVCSKFNDFDIHSRNLLESLLNRGFSKYRLKNSYNHTFPEYLISTIPQPCRIYRHAHRPRKRKIDPKQPLLLSPVVRLITPLVILSGYTAIPLLIPSILISAS